jgi:Tfp pilus assembly protein PilF
MYASDSFLVTSTTPKPPVDLSVVPDAAAIVASSPYLRTLLEGRGASARRVAFENLRGGRLLEAEEGFETARALDPNDPAVYEGLAEVFTAMGKPEVAARALADARLRRVHAPVTAASPQ